MREPIDRKFEIAAMSLEHGNRHDKFDSVLFLAKDRAFLEALPAYRDACIRLGADERQIRAVELLIERVRKFQENIFSKVPDVDPGPAGDPIVAPNEQ